MKFDKVIIDCSPFVRCMMTAAQIAKVLDVDEVMINYRATELLYDYYDFDPMPFIEWTKYGQDFNKMRNSVPDY